MTKGDLTGVSFFGRPFKPVSLGLVVIMTTLLVYNLTNTGIFGDRVGGDIVAAAAAVSIGLLTASWWARSQWMLEVGLFLACLTYIGRTAYLLMVKPEAEGVALGLGIIIIAGGAYLLERTSSDRVA